MEGLLPVALRAGVSLSQFWDDNPTPWELSLLIQAAIEREQMREDSAIANAWLTALWANLGFNGKLPPLESVLHRKRQPDVRQSPAVQRAIMQVLTDAQRPRD